MTQKQAFVYWHRAAGFSYEAIAKKLKASEAHVKKLMYYAIAKSRKAGVSYVLNVKKEVPKLTGSSSAQVAEVVKQKKLEPRGFAALKALADEIAADRQKIQKKDRKQTS